MAQFAPSLCRTDNKSSQPGDIFYAFCMLPTSRAAITIQLHLSSKLQPLATRYLAMSPRSNAAALPHARFFPIEFHVSPNALKVRRRP